MQSVKTDFFPNSKDMAFDEEKTFYDITSLDVKKVANVLKYIVNKGKKTALGEREQVSPRKKCLLVLLQAKTVMDMFIFP